MKTNFTRLLSLTALFFTVLNLSAQDAYRTNLSSFGQWTTVASWQRFDIGTSTWVAATAFPTSADDVITVLAGDSLILSGATSNISIDQVVVEPGGVLTIFNNTGGAVVLNNGAGDDISVDGRLYFGGAANLTGTGTIVTNASGLFTLRNTGVVGAPVINNGTMHLGAPGVSAGTFSTTTFTNNGSAFWIDGNANLASGATFVNNGTLEIQTTGTPQWNNTAGPNTITNNGVINKTNSNSVVIATAFTNAAAATLNVNNGTLTFNNSTVGSIVNAGLITGATGSTTTFNNLNNSGTLAGNGSYTFTTASITNTGILSPGLSPGSMSISAAAITGRTPSINIELASDGAVAGTNYDVLNVVGPVNVTGTTFNLSNNTSTADIVGTTYTVMTSSGGAITGPFAAVNIPTNFSLTYNTNSIVITKTALFALPVSWGAFNAVSKGNKVELDWTTLMEENTSYFVIEHATDPAHFSPIAQVQAKGNSTYTEKYKFTFNTPELSKTNFFRIKQVDLDGKSSYSGTRSVKFDKGQAVAIQVYPNPVKDVLQLNIQRENIQVILVDQSGRTLQQRSVQPGQHTIDMQSYPTGIYQLAIFEKGVRIDTKQIVKQ
jgi:hypothetical protein